MSENQPPDDLPPPEAPPPELLEAEAFDDLPPVDVAEAGMAPASPGGSQESTPGASQGSGQTSSAPVAISSAPPERPLQPASSPVSALKIPPHSIEAEQSVLGGLMLNNLAWFDVADQVLASEFYRTQHQIIYEALAGLSAENEPMDGVTVAERLTNEGLLEKAGGIAYLGELTESTPGAGNVVAYARIVRERATLRRLIAAANKIADFAFTPGGRGSEEVLSLAEQEIFDIAEGRLDEGGPEKVMPILKRTVQKVEELVASGASITGMPTGFDELDKKTAGLQPGEMIIVAGRPSMGKTSFAMNLVEHAVMEDKGAVLVFSLEMPAEALTMRMLSSLGRIDQTRLRTGDLKDEDWARFTSAVSQLKDRPLYIDDTAGLSPADLRTRARRVAREAGSLGLIMVDYLQLMRGTEKTDNRTNEISEISRSLKALAKEMRCPVIALSQLNRALENRTDRRPVMADLRESGAIEQDADVIMFIYRDEVYNEESPDKGTAEIIIGKQRNGPTGTIRLSFIGNLTKFENLASDIYNDYL